MARMGGGLGRQEDGDVQILGSDGTTVIGNISDQIKADDVARTSGVYSELTVGTSAVEAKVGGSLLSNRKYIYIRPKDNSIYMGYSNAVTTTTGMRIFKDELLMLPIGVAVWLIADGSNKKVSIGELS